MRAFLRVFSALVVLLVCSCSKEPVGPESPVKSPMLQELIGAFASGEYFLSADCDDDCYVFKFADGSSFSIPKGEIKVIDGRIFDRPRVALEDDRWTINLVSTDFYLQETSFEDSYPLCIWYDSHNLSVYMTNGEQVNITTDPLSSMLSFGFYTQDNRLLKSDIICTIEGTNIIGKRPSAYSSLKLKPRFEFDAMSISVDGVEQISGKSTQDFSHPVQYDLEYFDGSVLSFTVDLVTSNTFPTIYINTDGYASVRDKKTYVPGFIRFEDPLNEYSDVTILESRMKIKGRGNSTWDFFPKKPYHIKLDEKSKVYGLPKNRDWIVMANYNDKSLLRNEVAMELSRICGFSWTPTFYPVELYFNNQYMGVYAFGDHKEVAGHRVDIQVAGPKDNSGEAVTGGYYLELECYPDEPYNFWTEMGIPLTFKEPESPTDAQFRYMQQYCADFEKALQADYFSDPDRGYEKYIDLKSFIDNYIIEELTKDYDGNLHKSSFFTKERGKKLEVYHLWDFDLSLGNCNFFSNYGISGGPTTFFIKDYGFQGYGWGWYFRLFQDDRFRKMVKARWNELMPQMKTIPDFVRTRAAYLEKVAANNFERWDILNVNVWSQRRIPGSWQGELDYLIEFYTQRLEWLDNEINKW